MLTPTHIIRDGNTNEGTCILLTECFPKIGCEGNSQREFVCDADAKSLS